MADDNIQRPYRKDAPSRAASPSGNDPLAELARLIGQNEAFSAQGRVPGRDNAQRTLPAPHASEPQPPANQLVPGMSWDSGPAAPGYGRPMPLATRVAPAPQGYGHAAAEFSAQPSPVSTAFPGAAPTQPYDASFDHPTAPDQRAYNDDVFQTGAEPFAYPTQPDEHGYDPNRYDPSGYHTADGEDQASRPEYYEDETPPRRRMIAVIAAAVLLAVLGTAGAFGYRAIFGSSGSSPPPVIKADTAPSKVVPATASSEPSNKLITDRVGDRSGAGERLVSREEQPLDVKPPVSRVVGPAGIPPAAAGQSSSAAPAAGALASTEPKKIRTVAIKPDQPGLYDPAPPTPPASGNRAGAAPQASASGNPAPPVRNVQPRAVPAASGAAGGPLSLSPAPINEMTPMPPRTTPLPPAARVASVPAATAPAATSSTGGGGYSVQVSSQRSEADAQSSFQALQGKFPNVLGSRQAAIRRADLGAKGTYYRAMVGPFGSADEANEVCGSLKSAGGSCIVQRN